MKLIAMQLISVQLRDKDKDAFEKEKNMQLIETRLRMKKMQFMMVHLTMMHSTTVQSIKIQLIVVHLTMMQLTTCFNCISRVSTASHVSITLFT